MAQRLTQTIVRTLDPPARGNRILYDTELKGFGCRVTAAGARAFILNYRTRSGRERRFTIGKHPVWTVTAAREEAARLLRRIDDGDDPLGNRVDARVAPTVAMPGSVPTPFVTGIVPRPPSLTGIMIALTRRSGVDAPSGPAIAPVSHPGILNSRVAVLH